MDYEKKYKEALEKARQLCAYPTSKPFISDLQDLFPELAESEDERIRKEIIDFATKANNGVTSILANNYNFNKWLAWLEKQGEQKPAWSKEDEKMIDEVILDLIVFRDKDSGEAGKAAYQREIDWLKSLKERVQPKQEWSEEDERYLNNTISYLKDATEFKETAKLCIDWLKSLKPQPKQEWSEDDEKKRKGLIKGLEDRMGFGWASDPFSREEYIDWLKSLRPQKKEALPQWRRLPLNGVSYAPDYWCVMDVITSTVGANSASVSALVKGDYYVPLFELEKFIRNI